MEQTQKKKTAKPYSPEFRERAVRLAMEHRDEYQSEAAVDLSRFGAAPSARLGHLTFESHRAFPSQS